MAEHADVSRILADFVERRSAGADLDAEELLRAHPEVADELRQGLEALDVLELGDGTTLPLPEQLGEYRIVREIGRGGMGVVYEANQKSLNRRVALKVLSTGLGLTTKAVMRFKREAEAAAKLHHSNIVPIYSTGDEGRIPYYAMELVDGMSLKEHLARHPNDLDEVARCVMKAAEALHSVHEEGVLHRDVKPSNILVTTDGRVKLTDFGLAREQGLPSLTMTGDFAGTPSYVAPEQAHGKPRFASDVFSASIVIYEMLAGTRPEWPFKWPLPGITRLRKNAPTALIEVLRRGLQVDHRRRYKDAAAMARALDLYGQEVVVDGEGVEHAWRAELCGRVIAMQSKADGSWINRNSPRWWEGNPTLATAYAMLTLGAAKPAQGGSR